jgi:hypothetical protein
MEAGNMKGIEIEILAEYVFWLKAKKKMNMVVKHAAFGSFEDFYRSCKRPDKNTIGLGSVTINSERAKEVDFSAPYMKDVAFCVTNGNAPDIKSKSPDEIINRVASSGITSIDLEEFIMPGERVLFDLKPHLFQQLILKEKDFRDFIKSNDWSVYTGKHVALVCTADAIVPTWAYMLLTLALEPFAATVVFGDLDYLENFLFTQKLSTLDKEKFRNARVVIKGCGDKKIPVNAFVSITSMLKPFAKSIMYGEPCSTVPLYKAKG